MSKSNHYNSNAIPAHLEDDIIIAFLDGELSEEEKNQSSQHLENCWSCRGKLKIIQDSIDNFMCRRQEILMPIELPPSDPALKLFQERLQNYKLQTRSVSMFNFSRWKSKLNFSKFYSTFNSAISFNSPVRLRMGIASLAVLVIAALLLQQSAVQTVSAAELLKNAEEASKSSLATVSEPVIHQKFEVRRTKNNLHVDSVNWETWQDTNKNNFRDAIDTDGSMRLILDKFENRLTKVPHILENERPVLLTELGQILQFNHMNPQNPLSAASVKAWKDSVQEKNEEVVKSSSNEGIESYELKINRLGDVGDGQIIRASYNVRANDWIPLGLRIEIMQADGATLGFQIIPQTSEIIARSQLSSDIFPETQIAAIPNPLVSPKEKPSPSDTPESLLAANANANSAQVIAAENKTKRLPASAELEVEVLNLLSRVKADMGEQIDVKRTADGFLVINGIVETAERKTEILNSLDSVADNSSVKIEIYTVAEAVAKNKQSGGGKSSPVTNAQGVEVQNLSIAAEPQLREYFRRQGGNTDETIRSFAASRVAQSRQAMQHLGALKKLAGQFKPEELKTLKPEAREKWLSLVRSHARAFQEQTAALRRELKPVFFAGANDGAGKGANISNDLELINAVRRLYDDGAANDSVIRSAFTASGAAAGVSAIAAPQFWQSLKDSEALAQKIQSFR